MLGKNSFNSRNKTKSYNLGPIHLLVEAVPGKLTAEATLGTTKPSPPLSGYISVGPVSSYYET